VLIALERFVFRRLLDNLPPLLCGLMTYAAVLVGWIVFYFTDTAQMVTYLRSLIGLSAEGTLPLFTAEVWLVIKQYSWFPLAALAAALPLWKAIRPEVLDRLHGLHVLWLVAVFVLSVLMIVGQSYNPFIYFRF